VPPTLTALHPQGHYADRLLGLLVLLLQLGGPCLQFVYPCCQPGHLASDPQYHLGRWADWWVRWSVPPPLGRWVGGCWMGRSARPPTVHQDDTGDHHQDHDCYDRLVRSQSLLTRRPAPRHERAPPRTGFGNAPPRSRPASRVCPGWAACTPDRAWSPRRSRRSPRHASRGSTPTRSRPTPVLRTSSPRQGSCPPMPSVCTHAGRRCSGTALRPSAVTPRVDAPVGAARRHPAGRRSRAGSAPAGRGHLAAAAGAPAGRISVWPSRKPR